MRPIQVYLDSADFSNASNSAYFQSHPDFHGGWEALQQMCAAGDVVCRFSVVHMMEITHVRPEDRPYAEGRAKAIKALCGSHALRFISELKALDGAALVEVTESRAANLVDRSYAYTDQGEWLPLGILNIGDLRTQLQEKLKALIKENLPPHKRRKAREMVLRGSRISAAALDAVKANESGLVDFEKEFPVTDRFHRERMFIGFVEGTVSQEELVAELYKGFADPFLYVSHFFEKYDKEKVTIAGVRNYGKSIVATLDKLRVQVDDMRRIAPLVGQDDGDVRALLKTFRVAREQTRAKELLSIYAENAQWLRARSISKAAWDRRVISSSLGDVPAVDFFGDLVEEYIRGNVNFSDSGQFRKLRESDGGDLMHAMYLPYVDFFHADGNTANLIASNFPRYRRRVCSSLPQLVAAVKSEVARRHSAKASS